MAIPSWCIPCLSAVRVQCRLIAFRANHPKLFHRYHLSTHLVYFAFVFIEGHGMYATMGGVLLVSGIAAMVMGEEG